MSESTTRIIKLPVGVVLNRSWYASFILGLAILITGLGTIVLQRATTRSDQERFLTAVNLAEVRLVQKIDYFSTKFHALGRLIAEAHALRSVADAASLMHDQLVDFKKKTNLFIIPIASGNHSEIHISVTMRSGVNEGRAGTMTPNANPGDNGHLGTTRFLESQGHSWIVTYRSTEVFDAGSNRILVPIFAGVGIGVGIILYLLSRSHLRSASLNATLYQQAMAARREAELSLAINCRLASTLDAHAIAQEVTDAGCELTGAHVGAFFTTAGLESPVIDALSGHATLRQGIQGLAWTTTLYESAANQNGVINFADVRLDPRNQVKHSGDMDRPLLASCLTIAVRSRTGTLLGGLVFACLDPGRFLPDHERLLKGLAAQAAIAFDHAHLYAAEIDARRIAGLRADDLGRTNAELQQFIYVSSHDLQEPLRTITQYLDLLQRRHGALLNEEACRYITYTSESAVRMYTLLNDLLIYSRLGHDSRHTSVDLGGLLEEVLQDLRMVLNENAAKVTMGTLPAVLCDHTKIRTLFQNLIGNAIKFKGSNSPIIEITAIYTSDSGWIISVIDHGIGIRNVHHEAVFEVFHRLHEREAYPGTGIGLAICRRIVEQHGGRIWIEDTPGGGATFLFNLPETGTTRSHVAVKS